MNLANVKLSNAELSLACDANIILTKNRIIEKLYLLFGELSTQLPQQAVTRRHSLSPEIYVQSAKIYKGEKYVELPYVLLDYPRCFKREDVLAVRHFFWWGNFFSVTLHLAGKYAEQYGETILKNLYRQENEPWFICVNEDQWQHHFEQDNFMEVHNSKYDEQLLLLKKNNFIKVAQRLPLQQWDDAFSFFMDTNEKIFNLLEDQR